MYELSRNYHLDIVRTKDQAVEAHSDSDTDSENASLNIHFNRHKYMFDRKYNPENLIIYSTILQKFISCEDKPSCQADDIDLNFLLAKMKDNINPDKIHIIVAFDKASLEAARKVMLGDEENEVKNDIAEVKTKIDNLATEMISMARSLSRIEAKLAFPHRTEIIV